MKEPGEPVTIEYLGVLGDGERGWFESNIRAIVGEDGEVTGTVSAIRNVGHRKQLEASLRSEAETNQLTGLPNRRGFDAALRRAVREAAAGRPTVLAVFDLDHFKAVNDSWGHPGGRRGAGGDGRIVRRRAARRRLSRRGSAARSSRSCFATRR